MNISTLSPVLSTPIETMDKGITDLMKKSCVTVTLHERSLSAQCHTEESNTEGSTADETRTEGANTASVHVFNDVKSFDQAIQQVGDVDCAPSRGNSYTLVHAQNKSVQVVGNMSRGAFADFLGARA